MEKIIEAKDVWFHYQNEDFEEENAPIKQVLKGISLDIKRGEFVAVLGHNGSGKSTIAKHFNAILTADKGTILVDGIDASDDEKLFDIRQRVGMVFQNPDNQIVATIVEEDVAFALENLGVDPVEMRERVDDALKDVGMYKFREHAPHQLSGGQKQRVAIAGIIAMCPDCIVLDEPTAMLDPIGRKEVMKTIKKLNREHGVTIILITHYMDEAAKADRIVVMDSGKTILDGTPKEVFKNVELLKSVGLDVPQVTELAFGLRNNGIDIPDDIITEEECIEEIIKIIEKAGK
ncbi:MAG: energy-coupling factor transporter ATPase [Oscillospiraceae bacterium]|nr:energy-coupling factor transporter ATPase [Oscillospiraceae bacterium]